MKLMKSKKGKLSTQMINTAILGIVILVVLFKLYAELVPEAGTVGDEMSDASRCVSDGGGVWNSSDVNCRLSNVSGTVINANTYEIPLAGLFSSSGLVFIIVMASLVVVVVKAFMPGSK